ncbi:MAG: cyclic nucleotide-binding domain-containing protein [Acidobacteriota bacterium]
MKVGGSTKASLDEFSRRVPKGTEIFHEGDPAADMFIIQSGSVRITRTVGREVRELAVLEKADFFGEMAILEDYPERSATATAVTDVELLQLRATDLEEMLQRRPWIAMRMMAKLSERVREANRRLEEAAEREAEASELPPAPLSQGIRARAILYQETAGHVFGIKPEGDTTLGRHDPVTGVTPDIDLSALDPDRTVSRRHASIRSQGGALSLTETNAGTNGSFLNGEKLEPFKPYPLADGDLIQLALVTMRVRILAAAE